MTKRRRTKHVEQPSGQSDNSPSRSVAPQTQPAATRRWILVVGAVVVLLGAVWLSVRAYQNAQARNALASLKPLAPLVPADQPERRDAMEVADQLLRDYPDSPESLYARGVILARYGFNDQAVKTWQVCLKLHGDLAPIYELLGIDALQRGENERAIELLATALRLDPESPVAGFHLGKTLNSLGRMEEAVPALKQHLEISPKSAEAHFQLGQAHAYLRDYEQAKKDHQAALREDPWFAQACYGLAVACERLGQTEESQEYRKRYVDLIAESRVAEQQRVRQNRDESQLQESLARAYVAAGQIYMNHNRPQEAQAFWRRAAAIDPKLAASAVLGASGTQPASRER